MNKSLVVSELEALVKESEKEILPTKWYPDGIAFSRYRVDHKKYTGWHAKTLMLLRLILPAQSDFIRKFSEIEDNYYSNAEASVAILESIIEYIEKGFIDPEVINKNDVKEDLRRIFGRFHKVARQLRNRHNGKATLEIDDEYDVQDLLHALLWLYFDDIRAEEWTPSYAGKASRMDFFLKNEGIVIEVKKTRQTLKDKEVGDQLIIDVERYKMHPDCRKLICFIYDPEGRIGNPEGLANDLNNFHKGFVEIIIEPNN